MSRREEEELLRRLRELSQRQSSTPLANKGVENYNTVAPRNSQKINDRILNSRQFAPTEQAPKKEEEQKEDWQINERRKLLRHRYNTEGAKNLSEKQLFFLHGAKNDYEWSKDPQYKNYWNERNANELYQKQKLTNQIKKRQNGMNFYDKSLSLDDFRQQNDPDLRKTFIYDANGIRQELGRNDHDEIKKAAKEGYEKVLTRWNDEIVEMDIEDALKFTDDGFNGWMNRRVFNTKNKGLGDQLKDTTRDGLFYTLHSLDALPGAAREFVKHTTNIENNTGNVFKNVLEGYKKGGEHIKRTLSGEYLENPEKVLYGDEMLGNWGWKKPDQDKGAFGSWGNFAHAATGFGIDVLSGGLNMGGLSQKVIANSGKAFGKNADEAAKVFRKNTLKDFQMEGVEKSTKNALFFDVVDAAEEAIKKGDDVETAISNIYAKHQKNFVDKKLINATNKQPQKLANRQERATKLFDNRNQYLRELLTDQATGPIAQKRGFGLHIPFTDGIEVLNREQLKGISNKTGLSSLGKAVTNLTPYRQFQKTFNKKHNVSPVLQQLIYDTQGKINLGISDAVDELRQATKGLTNKDLENLTAILTNRKDKIIGNTDNLEKIIKVGDKEQSVIDHFKDIRSASLKREQPYKKGLSEVDDYMPGKYIKPKMFSEQKMEDTIKQVFGVDSSRTLAMNPHKSKVFENLYEGEKALSKYGIKAEKNAANLLLGREAKSHEWLNKEILRRQVDQLEKMNPKLKDAFNSKYVNDFINPNFRQRGFLGTQAKGATDTLKRLIMNTLPAQFMRNLYGGMVNNHVTGGVSLGDYVNSLLARKRGLTLSDGTKLSPEEFKRLAAKNGVDNTAVRFDLNRDMDYYKFGSVRPSTFNPLSNDFFWTNWAGKGHETGEKILRGSKFINQLRKSKATKDNIEQSARYAGNVSRNTHFDYNPQTGLTDREQFIRDYLIPFYTFQRFNTPLQAKAFVQNPGRINNMTTYLNNALNVDEGDNKNDPNFPDYARRYLHLGNDTYVPMTFSSTNEFLDWDEPGKKVLGSLNPFIKTGIDYFNPSPYQLGSGMSMRNDRGALFGQGLSSKMLSRTPNLADALGIYQVENKDGSTYNMQDVRKQVALQGIIPHLNNANSLFKAIEKDGKNKTNKNTLRRVLGNLTGFTARDIDVDRQRGYGLQDALARTDEDIDFLQRTGKIEENKNFEPIKNYEVENSWKKELEWYNDAKERLEQGQSYENPHIGKLNQSLPGFSDSFRDNYNQYAYDPYGNVIDFVPKYPEPRTEFQSKLYEAARQLVEQGRQQSQEDLERYRLYEQQGVPSLKEYFELYQTRTPHYLR